MKKAWNDPRIQDLDVKMSEWTPFKKGSDGCIGDIVESITGVPIGNGCTSST